MLHDSEWTVASVQSCHENTGLICTALCDWFGSDPAQANQDVVFSK